MSHLKVDLVEASPQTCSAGSSDTPFPTEDIVPPSPPSPPLPSRPTGKPTKKPSGSAWGGWDPDGYSSPWGDGYWGYSKSAKSKGSKGLFVSSDKSSKAKSAKSSKISKAFLGKSSKLLAQVQWGDDGVVSGSGAGGGRVSSSQWTHEEPIRDLRDGSTRRLVRQR